MIPMTSNNALFCTAVYVQYLSNFFILTLLSSLIHVDVWTFMKSLRTKGWVKVVMDQFIYVNTGKREMNSRAR
jgi:hypothetical protein